MSNTDHLDGDGWMTMYPNLFPDKHKKEQAAPVEIPEPSTGRAKVQVDSGYHPRTDIPPSPMAQTYMVHAMGFDGNAVCGVQKPPRATSPAQRDLITCPTCLHNLHVRPVPQFPVR